MSTEDFQNRYIDKRIAPIDGVSVFANPELGKIKEDLNVLRAGQMLRLESGAYNFETGEKTFTIHYPNGKAKTYSVPANDYYNVLRDEYGRFGLDSPEDRLKSAGDYVRGLRKKKVLENLRPKSSEVGADSKDFLWEQFLNSKEYTFWREKLNLDKVSDYWKGKIKQAVTSRKYMPASLEDSYKFWADVIKEAVNSDGVKAVMELEILKNAGDFWGKVLGRVGDSEWFRAWSEMVSWENAKEIYKTKAGDFTSAGKRERAKMLNETKKFDDMLDRVGGEYEATLKAVTTGTVFEGNRNLLDTAFADSNNPNYEEALAVMEKVQKQMAGSAQLQEIRSMYRKRQQEYRTNWEKWSEMVQYDNVAQNVSESEFVDKIKQSIDGMAPKSGETAWDATKRNVNLGDAAAGALMSSAVAAWWIEKNDGKMMKIFGIAGGTALGLLTDPLGMIAMKGLEMGTKGVAWGAKEGINLLFNASKILTLDNKELMEGNLGYLFDGKTGADRTREGVPEIVANMSKQAELVSPELGIPLEKILDNKERLTDKEIDDVAVYYFKAQKHALEPKELEKFLAEVTLLQKGDPYRDDIIAGSFNRFLVTNTSGHAFKVLMNNPDYKDKFTAKLDDLYERENQQKAEAVLKGIPYHNKVKLGSLLSEEGKNASPEKMKTILHGLNVVNVALFLWVTATIFANVANGGMKFWDRFVSGKGKEDAKKKKEDARKRVVHDSDKIKPDLREKLNKNITKRNLKTTLKLLVKARVITKGNKKDLRKKLKGSAEEREKFFKIFEGDNRLNLNQSVKNIHSDFVKKVNDVNDAELEESDELKLSVDFEKFAEAHRFIKKDRASSITSMDVKTSHRKRFSSRFGKGKEVDEELKLRNIKYPKANIFARARNKIGSMMVFTAGIDDEKGTKTFAMYKSGDRFFIKRWPAVPGSKKLVIDSIDMTL